MVWRGESRIWLVYQTRVGVKYKPWYKNKEPYPLKMQFISHVIWWHGDSTRLIDLVKPYAYYTLWDISPIFHGYGLLLYYPIVPHLTGWCAGPLVSGGEDGLRVNITEPISVVRSTEIRHIRECVLTPTCKNNEAEITLESSGILRQLLFWGTKYLSHSIDIWHIVSKLVPLFPVYHLHSYEPCFIVSQVGIFRHVF